MKHPIYFCPVPNNCVVIGVYGLCGNYALQYGQDNSQYADVTEAQTKPSVVVSECDEINFICARTFQNHIYRQAFIRGMFRVGVKFSLRKDKQNILADVRQICEDNGFEAYWFSDDLQVCMGRRAGESLYIRSIQGATLRRTTVYGCVQSRNVGLELKSLLLSQFDLIDNA